MDADEIIVMDNGEIIDKGGHNYLYQNCEIYREIVFSQLEESEDLIYEKTLSKELLSKYENDSSSEMNLNNRPTGGK